MINWLKDFPDKKFEMGVADVAARERARKLRGEEYFKERFLAAKKLRASLPEGGSRAPAEWAPRRPEKSAWREGVDALDLTPIIIALEWDWALRPCEFSGPKMSESPGDVASARLAVVAPASCLWRFSTPNEWRTLCAQAATLAGNRKTAAFTDLFRRTTPIIESIGDAWREEGTCMTSQVQYYERANSGGFDLAARLRLNPGALSILPERDARGAPAFAARSAELRGAADRLIDELGAGWVIKGEPGNEAQLFLHGPWGQDCEVKKQALEACLAVWEANQISAATSTSTETIKAKAPRI